MNGKLHSQLTFRWPEFSIVRCWNDESFRLNELRQNSAMKTARIRWITARIAHHQRPNEDIAIHPLTGWKSTSEKLESISSETEKGYVEQWNRETVVNDDEDDHEDNEKDYETTTKC